MTITVQDPVSYLPVFAVETLPVEAVASVTDETRLTDLLFEKRLHTAGYDDFQITVIPVRFDDEWELVNQTPSVCDLDANGLVTRITNGLGKIHLLCNGSIQRIQMTFTSGESITYIWKGFTGTSVSSILSNTLRDMADTGGDLVYFENYTQGDIIATVNPDRWFTPDLSACGLATDIFDSWSTANSGCLIAPRVFIGVAHWDANWTVNNLPTQNLIAGRKIKFVNSSSTVYTRTVLSRYKVPGYDLLVCILDDVAMPGIVPMKIAGQWFEESLTDTTSRLLGMGFQLHQDKRVTACVFDAVLFGGSFPQSNAASGIVTSFSWLNSPTFFSDAESWLFGYDEFLTPGIPGDSGGVIGTVVDGDPVLVSLFTSPSSGFLYYEGIEDDMNEWIQLSADIAGVVITDTVTIAPSPL